MRVIALIVSGGEGKRFDKNLPKQFFIINSKSILEQCVKKFVDSNLFYKIVVVCNSEFIKESKKLYTSTNSLLLRVEKQTRICI